MMGDTQSNPESAESINQNKDMGKEIKEEGTKSLQLSDYEAFTLETSQKRNEYPSAFQFINIVNRPKDEAIDINDFSALGIPRIRLVQLAAQMINTVNPKISYEMASRLIHKIALGYNNVSYHNFTHGFQLMNLLRKCIESDENVSKAYTNQQKSYLYLAGLTHDINHEGYNNGFYVNLESGWAKQSNGVAVLEHMHIRSFFHIIGHNSDLNVLKLSSNPQKTKQMIVRSILATDMAKHNEKVQELKKINKDKKLNFGEDHNKQLFMDCLFHACDIGNSCASQFQELVNWSGVLMYQFNEQTKKQQEKNIKVSGFMKDSGRKDFYKGLIGFNSGLALPLWKQIVLSAPGIHVYAKNIDKNLKQAKEKQASIQA